MAIKPSGQLCQIREQIIEDPVSGLTFQFAVVPGTSVPYRLRVFGDLPNGNRELAFDPNGEQTAAGTVLNGSCAPSWLMAVD